MKLKNFLNNGRRDALFRELKDDFMPIMEKVTVPVTNFAKRNPRMTFTLMILVVITNIIILFHYTNAYVTRKGIGLKDMQFKNLQYGGNSAAPDIGVSFENIEKVRLIRDSLGYLMSLPHMTFQDTLTFVRVMDEFQKITSGSTGIPPLKLEDLRRAGPPGQQTK
jgi:hypothetical protein